MYKKTNQIKEAYCTILVLLKNTCLWISNFTAMEFKIHCKEIKIPSQCIFSHISANCNISNYQYLTKKPHNRILIVRFKHFRSIKKLAFGDSRRRRLHTSFLFITNYYATIYTIQLTIQPSTTGIVIQNQIADYS